MYQPPNNTQGSRNPTPNQPISTQDNRYPNPPDNRYSAGTTGGITADSRYQPANTPANQTRNTTTDNRYLPPNPPRQPGQPDQPVNPQNPTLERRLPLEQARSSAPPPPPFTLTAAELAQIDLVLKNWEVKSRDVKTFDSKFVRWEYDLTFPKQGPDGKLMPNNKDQGILKYAMPDKGVYRITYTESNGKWEPSPPDRIEHWVCDGNAVYEYKYPTNPNQSGQVVEYPLPPEMKGKAIADGPLPFLFGAEADKLRNRYYFRIATPKEVDATKQIWLEAYPKLQKDAANFSRAIIVLDLPEMSPKALQLFLPGGKNYNSYEFFDIVINDKLRIFQGNPFQIYTPRGWQRTTVPPPGPPGQASPQVQATRPATPAR